MKREKVKQRSIALYSDQQEKIMEDSNKAGITFNQKVRDIVDSYYICLKTENKRRKICAN